VNVDKAGRDKAPSRLELVEPRLDLTDPLDLPVLQQNVGLEGLTPRAVEDRPVADHERTDCGCHRAPLACWPPGAPRSADVASLSTAGGSRETTTP
jgi:hypothetical protein